VPENQATQRLAEIINRIAKLPSLNLEPPQFFANFLQLSIAATGSNGGAIWLIQPGQPPQCYCHAGLELCGINDTSQQRVVLEAIGKTVQEGKTVVLPPASGEGAKSEEELGSNLCGRCLFFRPLRAANQVAMVMQMIGSEELSPHEYRAVAGLLEEIGESAQTYLMHRRTAVLEDDRKALARLLQYTESVHATLDAEKVINQIANLGRDAIGCERLVVWIDPQIKRGLRAVSGVDKPDRRAVLMQTLENLSKYCLEIKKPIVASRQGLAELPEEDKLTVLLKDYFNASQLDQIFLQPIKGRDEYLGVVVAEGFPEEGSTNLAGLITAVSKHGAIALQNALEMASVPLVRPMARLKKIKKDTKKRQKWLTGLAIGLAALVLLMFVPWTIKIDCDCRLTPVTLRRIESQLDGVQIIRILKTAGPVQKDEVIAQLDDLNLRTQLVSLQSEYRQAEIERDQAKGSIVEEIAFLKMEKLKNQMDFVKWQIEMCQIKAPISGTILTEDLKKHEGLTVKKGDLICELADLEQWQLLLEAPQEEIDWVRRGVEHYQQETKKTANVEFLLAAFPQHQLQAIMDRPQQVAQQAKIKEKGNIFEIRLDVSPEQLRPVAGGLRDGMVGRAKIATVAKPLGYVLLRKVIRFFRMTLFLAG